MTKQWYEDEKKVVELAEFLVQSVELASIEELLEYFKHPDRYTEVWNIYEKERLNTIRISPQFSTKEQTHEQIEHKTQPSLSSSCSCDTL